MTRAPATVVFDGNEGREPGKTADKIMAAPEHRLVRRSGREDHPQFKAAFKSRPSSCAAATRERTTAPSKAKERGMTTLQDRVALVTGSSRGIGAAIATLFANEGARVVVHGRDTDAVELVRSQIEATGGQVISFIADLTRYREIEAMRPRLRTRLAPHQYGSHAAHTATAARARSRRTRA
jgi:hypothetical protein